MKNVSHISPAVTSHDLWGYSATSNTVCSHWRKQEPEWSTAISSTPMMDRSDIKVRQDGARVALHIKSSTKRTTIAQTPKATQEYSNGVGFMEDSVWIQGKPTCTHHTSLTNLCILKFNKPRQKPHMYHDLMSWQCSGLHQGVSGRHKDKSCLFYFNRVYLHWQISLDCKCSLIHFRFPQTAGT